MNFLLERIVRLTAVPFLSVSALVGAGFSFWVFARDTEASSTGKTTNASLQIAPLSNFGSLEVVKQHSYYSGYRIVFDQGDSNAQFDLSKGVYLEPELRMTLRDYDPERIGQYRISFSFVSSSHPTGTTCVIDEYAELSDASKELSVIGLSAPSGGGELTFAHSPSFEWKAGKKPSNSIGWGNLIEAVHNDTGNHYLVINIDNGL